MKKVPYCEESECGIHHTDAGRCIDCGMWIGFKPVEYVKKLEGEK